MRRVPLHEPEVEEAHAAVAAEQVVAGVRIAVERVQPVDAAEHEPEDRLGRGIALVLRPLLDLGEAGAVGELGGEHAHARQLVDDARHVDERMVRVPVGEEVLIVGLDAVVELLDEPGAQLLDERSGLEAREEQPQRAEDQVGVQEVGADRLADPGVLHLDRDGETRVRHRPVYLADRGGGDRGGIPLREQPVGIGAELFAHDLRAQLGRHRRRVLLQRGESVAHRLGQPVVEIARHLAELHERALQLAERVGDVGRGPQLVLRVELGAAFGRRSRAARGVHDLTGPGLRSDGGEMRVARDGGVPDERACASSARGAPRADGGRDDRGHGQDGCRHGSPAHVATVAADRYT